MTRNIIFVCLGNICRSPLAEGIAREYTKNKGYDFIVDSAGTSGYHSGESPHQFSIKVAKENQINIAHLKSSKVSSYMQADYFVAMDQSNVYNLINLGIEGDKILKIGDFGLDGMDIPDPYDYKGLEGFYEVFKLLDIGVKNLLDTLEKRNQVKKDINILYDKINEIDAEIFKLYDSLIDDKHFFYQDLIQLCKQLNLPIKPTIFLALADRILQLKEGALLQELKNLNFSQEAINHARVVILEYVEGFYKKRNEEILDFIKEKQLLTKFYSTLFNGIHQIGLSFNTFARAWFRTLFFDLYPRLEKKMQEKEILKLLQSTIDVKDGAIGDRSYSIATIQDEKAIPLSYAKAFPNEVLSITNAIQDLIIQLECLNDEVFNQKEQYLNYLKSLKNAFETIECDQLISKWQKVDSQWMQIKTPLQIGHPFEYYEDKYRHSVAPEWDLRLSRTDNRDEVSIWINKCFSFFCKQLNPHDSLKKFTQKALKQVVSYNAIPAFFYGSNLNGLFSAQVVPNDEEVTQKYGKKIFAFPDRIIKIAQNKPKMLLAYKTFGKKVMQNYYDILFHQKDLWYKIYEITTNGHEYGHILWMESDTQVLMNKSGMFKNIEEFKATSGGLCAFFLQDCEKNLFDQIIIDNIIRAVGLIAWREQDEVLPYYYEGLIHLYGAFFTKSIEFKPDDAIKLHIYEENFSALKQWYIDTYQSLAQHYIQKGDAKIWLENFVDLSDKNPSLKEAKDFTKWYWEEYQLIGREILDEKNF